MKHGFLKQANNVGPDTDYSVSVSKDGTLYAATSTPRIIQEYKKQVSEGRREVGEGPEEVLSQYGRPMRKVCKLELHEFPI